MSHVPCASSPAPLPSQRVPVLPSTLETPWRLAFRRHALAALLALLARRRLRLGLDTGRLHEEALALLSRSASRSRSGPTRSFSARSPTTTPRSTTSPAPAPLMGKKGACGCVPGKGGRVRLPRLRAHLEGQGPRPDQERARVTRGCSSAGTSLVRLAEGRREAKYREKLGDRYAFVRDEEWQAAPGHQRRRPDREMLLQTLRRFSVALGKRSFPTSPPAPSPCWSPGAGGDYARESGPPGAAGFYSSAPAP